MSALSVSAILYGAALDGLAIDDCRTSTGTTAATGAPINGAITRFTTVPASSVAVLPNVLTGGGAPFCIVINAGANTLVVTPAVGDFNNGTVNAGNNIPVNQAAVYFRVPTSISTTAYGWVSAVIP